jgi:diguanylate cyclase (GGDEF)-like protein
MLTEFEHKYERTYCARYGGEEFVFVMENYSINEAVNIAEEIRKYAEENLKGGNEKEKRPVLVSIGVTSYPEFARDPRELFKNSDEALYLAKEEGRNRVKSILDVKKTDRRKR